MFDKSVYVNRRKQLIDKMSGGLVLILGNEEAPANYPSNTYKFRQDSSFLYFFGLNMPGFAGLMDVDSGDVCLYGNDVDMDDIIWMGPQPSVKDLAASVGVTCSAPFGKLAGALKVPSAMDARFISYRLIVITTCYCWRICWVFITR